MIGSIVSGITSSMASPIIGVPSDVSLASIIPGVNFQIDATLAASYPGTGQDYFNLINVPSDGTSKAGYDFFLGLDATVSTDDPTFTGTAGTKAAYFAHDGGDDFKLKTNTTFINDFARTDQVGSVYMVCAFEIGTLGAQQLVFGTASSSSTVGGFRFEISLASNSFRMQMTTGTGVSSVNLSGTASIGVPYLAVIVYDKATQTFKHAINARTLTTDTPLAIVNTVTNTSAFKFGGAGLAAGRIMAGSKTYGIAGGTGDLSNAQASAIVDYYNNLHGRTYA